MKGGVQGESMPRRKASQVPVNVAVKRPTRLFIDIRRAKGYNPE